MNQYLYRRSKSPYPFLALSLMLLIVNWGSGNTANAQPSAGQLLQQIQTENPVVIIPEADNSEGQGKTSRSYKSR